MLDAAAVAAWGPSGAAALAPQANAVPPFGVFGDLRWLAVYPSSWGGLVLAAIGLLAVRGLLTALTVAAAWPADRTRPSTVRLVGRGIAATALAGAFLAPCAAMLYGLAVVPVSWLFLAAVPAALLVALLVNPVAVDRGWWRRPVPARAVGWVLADFVAVSLAAVAVAPAPRLAAVPVAAVTGVANAWAWAGLVRAVVAQPRRRLVLPMVPVGLAAVVVLVVGGTLVGFGRAGQAGAQVAAAPVATRPGAVDTGLLVVSGYGSSWDGRAAHPVPGPYREEPFSYRGLDAAGRPLPYGPRQTVAPLPVLAARMGRQVAQLARRTGGPIDVVAVSEGALVIEDLLQRVGSEPVRTVVLASPLVDPAGLAYPAVGASGAGFATRDALTAIAHAFQGSSPVDLSPDSAFIRSVDQSSGNRRRLLVCPVAGVRQFALLPLADAVADPPTAPAPAVPDTVLASFHGGQLGDPTVDRTIAAVLRTGRLPRPPLLEAAESAIRAAAAWWVPVPATGPCR